MTFVSTALFCLLLLPAALKGLSMIFFKVEERMKFSANMEKSISEHC